MDNQQRVEDVEVLCVPCNTHPPRMTARQQEQQEKQEWGELFERLGYDGPPASDARPPRKPKVY